MRWAGLAISLVLVLQQLSAEPARADVKCYPDSQAGSGQAGTGTYPGSQQAYQSGMQRMQGGLDGYYQAARPPAGRAILGNPNCFVVPRTRLENGQPCVRDKDCDDKRCRPFPDGNTYCVAEGKACSRPGGDGVPGGVVITLHQQCYECKGGVGWKLCDAATKQALENDQAGAAAGQPAQ